MFWNLETTESIVRKSIVDIASGVLACDWVSGVSSFSWEVLKSPYFLQLLNSTEVQYLKSISNLQRLTIQRDITKKAQKFLIGRKLEVLQWN